MFFSQEFFCEKPQYQEKRSTATALKSHGNIKRKTEYYLTSLVWCWADAGHNKERKKVFLCCSPDVTRLLNLGLTDPGESAGC